MITVTILINGQPIMARSAVNTLEFKRDSRGKKPGSLEDDRKYIYRTDAGDLISHYPKDGAVALAIKMLKTIKEKG